MVPDPGGPKTYGSGSATLLLLCGAFVNIPSPGLWGRINHYYCTVRSSIVFWSTCIWSMICIIKPNLWMRYSLPVVIRAWLSMPKSQQSWVRSQHPPTQLIWEAADEAVLKKVQRKKNKKSPVFTCKTNFRLVYWSVPGSQLFDVVFLRVLPSC